MIQDNNDVLNEELISEWVSEVIHREVSKPDDEVDLELIDECEKTLSCLNDGSGPSEEELKKRLEKITGKISCQAASVHKRMAKSIRRTALAAACMVVVMIIGMITAYATVPSFNDMIRSVLGMPVGSSIDDSGITFINADQRKQYSSLDELIDAEKLNDYGVIFPTNLPDELKISSINYCAYDNVEEIVILFADGRESMIIHINESSEPKLTEEKIELNGLFVFISEKNGVYSGTMSYNKSNYYITSSNKKNILTIFEHMNKE